MPRPMLLSAGGFLGSPLGRGTKGGGVGRAGWPQDPGQAGLLEAEGAGAAGARQGSPPQSGIHSDSDGASAEQRGGGADARRHVEQSCSAERERQETGGTVLCRRAMSGERHINRVRSSQISNGFC